MEETKRGPQKQMRGDRLNERGRNREGRLERADRQRKTSKDRPGDKLK